MSISGWMDKDVVHIYNGILLSHKIEWNNATCSNMNAPRDYHTKWNKSERETQIPCDITYTWTLKYNTNEPIFKTETDSDLWLLRGRGDWGGMEWSLWWTGIYSLDKQQSPTVNHREIYSISCNKPSWKSIYVCKSLCCTVEIDTTL